MKAFIISLIVSFVIAIPLAIWSGNRKFDERRQIKDKNPTMDEAPRKKKRNNRFRR